MRVNTDDEVYRVDSVWLGPPGATFPWRARYVSYGVGLLAMMVIMYVQRRLGVPLDFFSFSWALVLAVVTAKVVGRRIGHERPLSHILTALISEVRTPRRVTKPSGGAVAPRPVRVRACLPAPRSRREKKDTSR